MGKRSQRRHMRYEKDPSGCMWGLISIFDFRHGRSTRRLLSDRRRGSRHDTGAGYSRSKLEILSDFDEKCQAIEDNKESTTGTADAGKQPSVKKLIEEEMFSEHDPKKQISNCEVEEKLCHSEHGGHIKKYHKRKTKTCKKTCDEENTCKESCDVKYGDMNAAENLVSEYSCNQTSEQQDENLDINAIMEELCSQIHQNSIACLKHHQPDELHMPSEQQNSIFEEKLSEATKVFINQKFNNGKHLAADEKVYHSKEFLDALQTLNSNKELLMRLLQDPKSLLVKHVQVLLDSQVEKDEKSKSLEVSNFQEQGPCNSRPSEELINRKQSNFFRRKIKPHSRSPSGNVNVLDSNRIVILKPGPTSLRNSEINTSLGSSLQSTSIMRHQGPSEKATSHFSLTEIKRKFKHAVGKDRVGMSMDNSSSGFSSDHDNLRESDKGIGNHHVGRNSPTREHFFTERIPKPSFHIKKREKICKPKNSELNTESETSSHPEQRVSNIYIEAKKHLSDMLSHGDEDEEFFSRQVPKTLGRILSLPEFSLSPTSSPVRDREHTFATAQMRFSAYDKIQRVNSRLNQESSSCTDPSMQNFGTQQSISDNLTSDMVEAPSSDSSVSVEVIHDNVVERDSHSVQNEINSEVDMEIVKTSYSELEEERKILDFSSEPSSCEIIRDEQDADIVEICDESRSSECLKLDLVEENQPSSSLLASPTTPETMKKVEGRENGIDRTERPSPISVLEPLFAEDDVSPASSIACPAFPSTVELPMQPLVIQFEEHDYHSSDQGIHIKSCMEDKECIFEYIKAVLQASGLRCDEFFVRLLPSEPLLDPSLFDEVDFVSNQLYHDQKLLFDCINEVLMEGFVRYLGCSPWVSFVKPNTRPIPNSKNVIFELWEGVNWHIHPQHPPRSLDQIVRKDMAKSGEWMDLRLDTESTGFEIGEAIFEELIEDAILSCASERQESGFSAPSVELPENESCINL